MTECVLASVANLAPEEILIDDMPVIKYTYSLFSSSRINCAFTDKILTRSLFSILSVKSKNPIDGCTIFFQTGRAVCDGGREYSGPT